MRRLVKGFFVAIEGPSGVGKSTVSRLLADLLRSSGVAVFDTNEPSNSSIGRLARFGTEEYCGLTLACLVAADRYHHLKQEVIPALDAGKIVICDRYFASSLVLQSMDGVPSDFVWNLNREVRMPDLTLMLLGEPEVSLQRAGQRGAYSRFHSNKIEAGELELSKCRWAAEEMAKAGYMVVTREVGSDSAFQLASEFQKLILLKSGSNESR